LIKNNVSFYQPAVLLTIVGRQAARKKVLTQMPTRYTFIEAIHKGQIEECEFVLVCRFPHQY
jgi:hypothetical protein